jgi:signal transduction histidine kinase
VIRTTSLGGDPVIVVEARDPVPTVVADEEMLRQVLANLIENALKYGSAERAPVTVRVAGQLNTVRFEIVDSGPGIPHNERAHVFEKFYRLDPHLRQGVRGTGLGLYICRELVHRMQGSIGVEASPSGGAAFWFELPRSWKQPFSEGSVTKSIAQQGSEA